MGGYFGDPDALWAIAQHYGLPTNFIDFSDDPQVAAFFACDTKTDPAPGQRAAIICLDSDDFLRFWKDVGPRLLKDAQESSYPHIIRINVDNLWRLQQQKGSFLWNPIVEIEQFYDFDRISFPYVKDDSALPRKEEIYPVHQSELEKLLTQFFMNEQMIEGNKAIANRTAIHRIDIPVGRYEAVSWCPAGIVSSSVGQNLGLGTRDWLSPLSRHCPAHGLTLTRRAPSNRPQRFCLTISIQYSLMGIGVERSMFGRRDHRHSITIMPD